MNILPGVIQVRLLYISIPGPPVIVFLSPTISQPFFQHHHQLPPRKSSFQHLVHLSHLFIMACLSALIVASLVSLFNVITTFCMAKFENCDLKILHDSVFSKSFSTEKLYLHELFVSQDTLVLSFPADQIISCSASSSLSKNFNCCITL